MTTALLATQLQFQTALLHGLPAAPGLLSARGDTQFGIYLNAYRARLRGALRENYEVLPLVMGDDAFDTLADAYVDAHPSRHYSLRWFGQQLADFLAQRDDLLQHPALLDVARMEWALRSAFDAAPARPWTADALASVPPEQWPDLRFALHPSVQILTLHWAVGPVWHALKGGQDDVPAPEQLDHHLLVWRDTGQHTQWKSLTDAESTFVLSLQSGDSFGQVCEALAASVGADQAALTAAMLLRGFLETAVVCGLQASTPETFLP